MYFIVRGFFLLATFSLFSMELEKSVQKVQKKNLPKHLYVLHNDFWESRLMALRNIRLPLDEEGNENADSFAKTALLFAIIERDLLVGFEENPSVSFDRFYFPPEASHQHVIPLSSVSIFLHDIFNAMPGQLKRQLRTASLRELNGESSYYKNALSLQWLDEDRQREYGKEIAFFMILLQFYKFAMYIEFYPIESQNKDFHNGKALLKALCQQNVQEIRRCCVESSGIIAPFKKDFFCFKNNLQGMVKQAFENNNS